jgi:hypothetical protein
MAPTPKELSEAVGISPSYASMILSESDDPGTSRTPPKSLAILIYRKLGWKHPVISDLTEEQMTVMEEVDPWVPKRAAA